MVDATGNGQAIPMVGTLPILSSAVEWRYELHEIGRANDTGEKVFLVRLFVPVGIIELWAPASFVKQLGEDFTMRAAGLQIARDIPPTS